MRFTRLSTYWSKPVKPRMFIASSVERLDLAYAAQENLEHEVEATVWTQDVFSLSTTAMASLIDVLDETDFAMFILMPDDVTAIRDQNRKTVRDNIIFELGLFVGRIGSDRCFLVVPRGVEDLHLPTDLVGLTPATFEPDRQDENLLAALGPACNRIRKAVSRLRQREPQPSTMEPAAEAQVEALTSDPTDCLALIESWMGSRRGSKNTEAIRYDDVDQELKLARGSARQYIEQAAIRWRLEVARKGQDIILFKKGSIVVPERRTEFF